MNPIGSFPDPAAGVRGALPKFSAETQERLIAWGARQPGSLGWLLQRTAAYWERHPGSGDEHHQRLDATAALDLLCHRVGAVNDRAAVEHLNLPLSKPDKPDKPDQTA